MAAARKPAQRRGEALLIGLATPGDYQHHLDQAVDSSGAPLSHAVVKASTLAFKSAAKQMIKRACA